MIHSFIFKQKAIPRKGWQIRGEVLLVYHVRLCEWAAD